MLLINNNRASAAKFFVPEKSINSANKSLAIVAIAGNKSSSIISTVSQ